MFLACAVFVILLVFSGSALGAGKGEVTTILEEEIAKGAKEEISFKSDSYFRYFPSHRLSAQSGRVSVTDAETEQSCELKAFGKLPVDFSIDTRYIGIENSSAVSLPPNLTAVTIGTEIIGPFLKLNKTYLFAGFYPSWSGSNWEFRPSAFRIPMAYSVIYKPNEKLVLMAGVGVYPDYEHEVLPLFGLSYIPNDKLSFYLMPPKPNITYALNKKISLFAEGRFSNNECEVDKDGFKNVVLVYRETHAGCGVKYSFNTNAFLSLSGGQSFWRRFRYRDSLGKVSIKDGPYINLRLEIKI